jgi:tryptophanase
MRYVPEPFKIKMVEPIRITTEDERRALIAAAHYNAFGLAASDVYIDLQTDSGTGAMSDSQWAALMRGDESYSGGRSYFELIKAAREIFEYEYIQPVHQGRAAEKVLFPVLVERPGQYVISNTFFDTTRAHVGLAGGRPIDCLCAEGLDSSVEHPFKGNMDVAALASQIAEHGAENVAGIVMTITNNSVGGQPVSMANMRAASEIARANRIPVVIDAARYAENAYFIQQREEGYAGRSLRDITKEFFGYADIFTMSAKKDAIANMGGLLGVREEGEHVPDVKSRVISYEGYVTYGGMSGRDLAAMAVGLSEGLDEEYLKYRIGQSQYLGARLDEIGVPYQRPAGGHAIFVDAGRLLPHIPWYQYPGQALTVELYVEAGIRGTDIGSYLMDRDPVTGEQQQAPFEFTRLALPRRVYTQSHLDVIAEALGEVAARAESVRGYEIEWEPPVLRHFTSRLRPVG